MKKRKLLAALLGLILAAGLVLAGCAPAGAVVAKIGNESITTNDLDLYANFILLQYDMEVGDVEDPEELKSIYDEALDTAVMFKVLMKKGIERKLYPLSEQDRKEIDTTISQYLDNELQTLRDSYQEQAAENPSINVDREARKALNDRMNRTRLTRSNLTQLLRHSKVAQILMDELINSVSVTEEVLKTGYDSRLAEQREQFTADPSLFEEAQAYGSPVVLYKPEGYRYIKHILIAITEEDDNLISAALEEGDEQQAETLRESALQKIKARADEALTKVNAGGDFDGLIEEYGEDPGMQNEPYSLTGYELGSESTFVEEFKQAAMGLASVGDTTGLVATDYGYHIIKWVGNVPSGPVPLEDVKEGLTEELLADAQETAWDAYLDQLKTEYQVERYPERFPTLPPADVATP